VSGSRTGFSTIYERAVRHKGADELEDALPAATTVRALRNTPDDRMLAMMAKVVFCAGFVWKVVENKWPGFEEAFEGFDPMRIAGYDEGRIDELATDVRIIRNRQKIVSTVDNARFVVDVADEYGGFGKWLASWPADDTIGMWKQLHSRGSRLGGFSGPLFLRHMGFDTFMLTGDVVKALVGAGVVSKQPTSQRDLRAVQDAFNGWRDETGRSLNDLSRIMAYSIG
jgi:3-methyladenine DNA glycosylase Tag